MATVGSNGKIGVRLPCVLYLTGR